MALENAEKLISLTQAAEQIADGSVLAIGGNVLHRAPMALVREIARQKKKGLRLVKTAGAMDIDLLCFAGCVQSVDAGYVCYESKYLLASHYREAVQQGRVQANEHACYTVISALRAACAGVPFMPLRSFQSDLVEQNDYFAKICDPFSNQELVAVRAIEPDVCILHVHEADEQGNARIIPPVYEDILMAKASKKVILTAEKIVPMSRLKRENAEVLLPHFLVDGVVQVEAGAAPCSCYPYYDADKRGIERFKGLLSGEDLDAWLESYEYADHTRRGCW